MKVPDVGSEAIQMRELLHHRTHLLGKVVHPLFGIIALARNITDRAMRAQFLALGFEFF
jgi:hypothetical protein